MTTPTDGPARHPHRLSWLLFGLLALAGLTWHERHTVVHVVRTRRLERPPTVGSASARYGAASRAVFQPACTAAGLSYPPQRLGLLAFKAEKRLEVWAADRQGPFRRLIIYPVLAASGGPGPKRRYGDGQVPEGFYRLTALNPASGFHLSIRVGYPNDEDLAHAVVPRERMGGDIYLHGGAASIGCLAIGDPAIEQLFCLVAQIPADQRRIIICPCDFRRGAKPAPADPWVRDLYARLAAALREFPAG